MNWQTIKTWFLDILARIAQGEAEDDPETGDIGSDDWYVRQCERKGV
jgi:hypothetical protein